MSAMDGAGTEGSTGSLWQHGQVGGVGSHLRGSRALLSAAGGTRELTALKLLIHSNGRRQEEEIESNVRFSD